MVLRTGGVRLWDANENMDTGLTVVTIDVAAVNARDSPLVLRQGRMEWAETLAYCRSRARTALVKRKEWKFCHVLAILIRWGSGVPRLVEALTPWTDHSVATSADGAVLPIN